MEEKKIFLFHFGMENLPDIHLLYSMLYKGPNAAFQTNIAELAAGRQCFIYVFHLKR